MEVWEQYTYRVSWSPEDEEYVALCAEIPGLSSIEPDPDEALLGIRGLARVAVEIFRRDGEPVPEPLSARRYSGTFMVRVPPEVHRNLVLEATEQRVSLNRLVSAKLSGPPVRAKRAGDSALAQKRESRRGTAPAAKRRGGRREDAGSVRRGR